MRFLILISRSGFEIKIRLGFPGQEIRRPNLNLEIRIWSKLGLPRLASWQIRIRIVEIRIRIRSPKLILISEIVSEIRIRTVFSGRTPRLAFRRLRKEYFRLRRWYFTLILEALSLAGHQKELFQIKKMNVLRIVSF